VSTFMPQTGSIAIAVGPGSVDALIGTAEGLETDFLNSSDMWTTGPSCVQRPILAASLNIWVAPHQVATLRGRRI